MKNWTSESWRSVVESAPEGIVICDATAPDCPVVFVNAAFSQMCGYPSAALMGSNLRMLQGTDSEQEGRTRLHEAIDGEADPNMGFGSLVTLQRYARIDFSLRIDLPWATLRDVSREASPTSVRSGS